MLPDDNQQLKKDAKFHDAGGISSGSEDGGAQAVGVVDENGADLVNHPPHDLLPPAGYQLLSPNNVPVHLGDDDDDDDDESDRDSSSTVTSNNSHGGNTAAVEEVTAEDTGTPEDDSRDPEYSNFTKHTLDEVANVWSTQQQSSTNSNEKDLDLESLTMEPDQCDRIRQCLSSFTLPAENIPSWAEQIPEGQWKDVLLERLKKINKPN